MFSCFLTPLSCASTLRSQCLVIMPNWPVHYPKPHLVCHSALDYCSALASCLVNLTDVELNL